MGRGNCPIKKLSSQGSSFLAVLRGDRRPSFGFLDHVKRGDPANRVQSRTEPSRKGAAGASAVWKEIILSLGI